MKKAALLFLIPGALSAAFNYYYSETTNDPSKWTSNGDFTTSTGGSKISNIAAPDGNSYEIKTTLSIKASGGTFVTYLRATSDALNSPTTANGSYYAIELQDVTVSGGACSATLAIYKTIAGSVQSLASMPFPCKDGMVFRITRNGSWFFM